MLKTLTEIRVPLDTWHRSTDAGVTIGAILDKLMSVGCEVGTWVDERTKEKVYLVQAPEELFDAIMNWMMSENDLRIPNMKLTLPSY